MRFCRCHERTKSPAAVLGEIVLCFEGHRLALCSCVVVALSDDVVLHCGQWSGMFRRAVKVLLLPALHFLCWLLLPLHACALLVKQLADKHTLPFVASSLPQHTRCFRPASLRLMGRLWSNATCTEHALRYEHQACFFAPPGPASTTCRGLC